MFGRSGLGLMEEWFKCVCILRLRPNVYEISGYQVQKQEMSNGAGSEGGESRCFVPIDFALTRMLWKYGRNRLWKCSVPGIVFTGVLETTGKFTAPSIKSDRSLNPEVLAIGNLRGCSRSSTGGELSDQEDRLIGRAVERWSK